MSDYFFFFSGLSLILTHEMDAIRLKEWKMFLLFSSMEESRGYSAFTAAHVPLYILLFWGLFGGTGGINAQLVRALDLFFIIHVGLHLLFMRHPHNQFRSPLSWALIGGAGLAGALDLLL
jgi:hypothetical protein